MIKHGKKYRAIEKKAEKKVYALPEAIKFIQENPAADFDETMDIAFRLGLDFTKSELTVRGMVSLPHGTGKKV